MSSTHQALLGRNFSHSSTPGIGPGDLEDVSPELWEELRLDSAGAEYDLLMRDLAEEEAQGTLHDLDSFGGSI